MTKICTKCHENKDLEYFHRNLQSKDGFREICKLCRSIEHKNKWCTDPAYNRRLTANVVKWQKANPEKVREIGRRSDTKRYKSLKRQEWIKTYSKSLKRKAYEKEYESRPERKKAKVKRFLSKLKRDINFRIRHNLRVRLNKAMHNHQKCGSAIRDLGCSIEEFRKYIEMSFYTNMSWDNYGDVWEFDHIIPLSYYNLSDIEQFKKACHFTNIQPLTISDNARKKDSVCL